MQISNYFMILFNCWNYSVLIILIIRHS